MPYYFVDGIRAGANAQSLYVQAENAEAAKTRAQALGLEPTGVRLAKNLDVPFTAAAFWRQYNWMSIPVFMIHAILLMMSMFFLSLSKISREPPYPSLILLLPLFNMMNLPGVNTVASHVAQLIQDRERMELELKELRQRLESLNPTV